MKNLAATLFFGGLAAMVAYGLGAFPSDFPKYAAFGVWITWVLLAQVIEQLDAIRL